MPFAIPSNSLQAAGISFIGTFAIAALMTGNPAAAVIPASAMALCSLISSVTVPLFKKIWNSEGETPLQLLGRTVVVIAATTYAANQLLNYRIDIFHCFVVTVLVHLFQHGTENRSMNEAQIYGTYGTL